jgi:hypothetical protein
MIQWAVDLLDRALPSMSWFEICMISLGLWAMMGLGLHLIGVF